MKRLLLLIVCAAIATLTYAQPSQATMTAKIKGDGSSITKVEFIGNGSSKREYDDGAWHNYFYQNYKTISTTDYPGITHVYSGVIRYENNQFDQYLIGDSWYEGVPDPDTDEIMGMLMADIEGFVKNNHYNTIVGELSDITFPEDAFHWKKLDHVVVKVDVTYTEPISGYRLETAKHRYEIAFTSEGYQKPWDKFISGHIKEDMVVLSTKQITKEEYDQLRTLSEIDAENAAKNFMASLPQVEEPPVFKSDKQLFYYIHEIIMTKPTKEVEAYLYKVMDQSVFEEKSGVLLKSWADKWYKNVIDNHEAYKGAHCMYPTVNAYQSGMITFYDRENKRMLRIKGTQSGDTWKLTQVDFYAAKSDELARMKENDSNCGEKPDLTVKEVRKYEIGDRVMGKFTQGWYAGTIDKKDPYDANRYHVLFDDGDQQWMKEGNLKPGTAAAETDNETDVAEEEVAPKASETFKVGDKVIVKTTQGDKKGKIIKYASHKYLVKFNDPRLGDTWCAPANLSHQ